MILFYIKKKRRIMKSLRYLTKSLTLNNVKLNLNVNKSSFFSTRINEAFKNRKDYEELFLNKDVRSLLKRLTGFNPMIVFATRSLENLNSPKYRFLTDEQLQKEIDDADKRAEKLLQMPPVKYSTEFKPRIFEKDDAIKGFIDSKFIFVDASPGYSDEVREFSIYYRLTLN